MSMSWMCGHGGDPCLGLSNWSYQPIVPIFLGLGRCPKGPSEKGLCAWLEQFCGSRSTRQGQLSLVDLVDPHGLDEGVWQGSWPKPQCAPAARQGATPPGERQAFRAASNCCAHA